MWWKNAHAAMSYARPHYEELNIPEDFFEKWDVHIHFSRCNSKDGPAGVTMTTALVSLMTDTLFVMTLNDRRGDIAGPVLPVGGIREKCLAALGQESRTWCFLYKPKDLADIQKEFKSKLNFILVENLDEVFAVAFDRSGKMGKKAAGGRR